MAQHFPYNLNAPRRPVVGWVLADLMKLREAPRELASLFVWGPAVDSVTSEYVAEVAFVLDAPYVHNSLLDAKVRLRHFVFGWDDGIVDLKQTERWALAKSRTVIVGRPPIAVQFLSEVSDDAAVELVVQRPTLVTGLRAEIVWQRLDAELGKRLARLETLREVPWPVRS